MACLPFVLSRARNWLIEQLSDGEPHTAKQLIEAAHEYGIARRTLQEARKDIGATSDRLYALNASGVKKLAAHVWQLREEQTG
jgi:hypothetical protein